jgi:hypothetical protein
MNVEAIFHEARKLSGEAREVYLKGACGHDMALRNKVELLLSADAEAGSFLAGSDDDPDATTGNPNGDKADFASSTAELPGQMIDRFKLLQLIGEGGFGTVWMAEQKEPVKRRVALKIIKLGMDTKQVIARFEAERQALAMMDHPNIAKVLDAGATETGRPYFVMEPVATRQENRARLMTPTAMTNWMSSLMKAKRFYKSLNELLLSNGKCLIQP